MYDDWIKSQAARRIFIHWTDPRPAWLWSPDGTTLLWRNRAAAFFGARLKKSGLRLAAEPVPIKGQIARLIRLGSTGRSSLARMQFIAGGRPASTTATVTPVEDANGRTVLLVVGVDPIDQEILAQPVSIEADVERTLLPAGASYLLVRPDGSVAGGTEELASRIGSLAPDADSIEIDGENRPLVRYKASPQGDQLVLLAASTEQAATSIAEVRADEGLAALERQADAPAGSEPLLPMDIPQSAPEPRGSEAAEDAAPVAEDLRLSTLFDRLAESDSLYAGLPARSDQGSGLAESQAAPESGERPAEPGSAPADRQPAAPETEVTGEPKAPAIGGSAEDVIAAVIEFEDDLAADRTNVNYRVTGRGFTPLPVEEPAPEPDPMDGESRRNFSEIGRILSGQAPPVVPDEAAEIDTPIEPMPAQPARSPEGALVSIGAETFILNRLPLGILVFRDQQILFANRALTDLVGYPTIDSLREAGLASIFPGDDPGAAGPVSQLVRQDGTRIGVTARLQSVTWQGRPALMLSAAGAERRSATETTIRDFARGLAALRDEGFVTLDPAGTIDAVSDRAKTLLGDRAVRGQALADLVKDEDATALRLFLDGPPRFTETTRPTIIVSTANRVKITIFAEGMAGIVRGYFGFVSPAPAISRAAEPAMAGDPAMLARISRGVRRPLNSIIGFADLIRSAAFGTIENHRYLEYARDIRTAGQEIAVLIDELDDYTRLNTGTFPVRPADLDLTALLDSCIVRVRGQASAARVLVRSAISEDLPRIRADRASLGQAILNLLASAIDQTPTNGSVILSAQRDDNGGVVINVRDSGEASADPGERFVVFRDGVGKDGETLAPVRSSVGLALTRSLLAVNACALTVTPAGTVGTIFSLTVPPELIGPAAA